MEKIYKSILCCIGICFIFLGLIVVVGSFSNSNMLPTDKPIQINNETFYLDNWAKIEEFDDNAFLLDKDELVEIQNGCAWTYSNDRIGFLYAFPQDLLWKYTTNYTEDGYYGRDVENIEKNHTIMHSEDSSFNVLFYRSNTLYIYKEIRTNPCDEKTVQQDIANFISNNNITEFYNIGD